MKPASNNFIAIREEFEAGMRNSLRETRRDSKGPVINLKKTDSLYDLS